MAEINAIATRRDLFIESLNQAYTDKYGNWLAKQSEEKRAKINKASSNIKHGLSNIAPLKCLGPAKCPFFSNCPIPDNHKSPGPDSDYPINLPCVLEAEYVAQQVISYVQHLEVDPYDPIEMSLINELALLDLLRNRAVMIISTGDIKSQGRDMMAYDEIITGWDEDGRPEIKTSSRVHPAIEIMDKHEKRRTKILEKFNATRESKTRTYGGSLDINTKLQQDIAFMRAWFENLNSSGGIVIDSNNEQPVYLDDSLSNLLGDGNDKVTKKLR